MGNIIKYEIVKLLKSKLIIISFTASLAFAAFLGIVHLEYIEFYTLNGSSFALVQFAQGSVIYPFIIAIIISSIVVTDYNQGVIRNMVMSGQTRNKIYYPSICFSINLQVVHPSWKKQTIFYLNPLKMHRYDKLYYQ